MFTATVSPLLVPLLVPVLCAFGLERLSFRASLSLSRNTKKTMPLHGLNTRPDIIVHIPFDRRRAERRDQGNFVAIELKLRATESDALEDFGKLERICEILAYPLAVFINIDSRETYSDRLPSTIAGRTACYAACLEADNPVIRMTDSAGTP